MVMSLPAHIVGRRSGDANHICIYDAYICIYSQVHLDIDSCMCMYV